MYKYTINPSSIKNCIRSFLRDSVTPENRKLFFSHPDKDFTRNRKLGLETLVFHLLSRSSGPLTHNLQKDFGLGSERPSKSALVQQVSKLKVGFFQCLFECINTKFHRSHLYKGKYRLLACDGTDLGVSAENKDCYRNTNQSGKPYCSIHINALYDILAETFEDCIIEKGALYNEQNACWKMVDKIKTPSIIICDRGYENYNLFAHLSKAKQFFAIRVKDKSTGRCIAGYWWKKLDGPDGEGEVFVRTRITKVNAKGVKASPSYHCIPVNVNFDLLPYKSPFKQGRNRVLPECLPPELYHEISFRLVRFRINPPGSKNEFETIATNLPADTFPAEELKKLYHLRWPIETGFRELKYDELLSKLHSVKVDSACKEVYIALILHNITACLLSAVGRKLAKKEGKKAVAYGTSHSDAAYAVRIFLGRNNRSGPGKPMQELARNLEPIRDGRSFPRKLIHKGFVAFTYRAA